MKCEHCNKENPDGARYCWNCGEKLPPSKPIGIRELNNDDSDILSQLDNLLK